MRPDQRQLILRLGLVLILIFPTIWFGCSQVTGSAALGGAFAGVVSANLILSGWLRHRWTTSPRPMSAMQGHLIVGMWTLMPVSALVFIALALGSGLSWALVIGIIGGCVGWPLYLRLARRTP